MELHPAVLKLKIAFFIESLQVYDNIFTCWLCLTRASEEFMDRFVMPKFSLYPAVYTGKYKNTEVYDYGL